MSKIDQELLDELRQDMMDEAYQEEQKERLYRTDYEALLDNRIAPLLDSIEELLDEIDAIHQSYGWQITRKEFIEDNL